MASRKKPAPGAKPWASRMIAQGTEAPDQLLANPRNARVHPQFQQQAVAAALDELGWIAPVIVNQTTGHVLDGHLRVALAISKGEPSVPVSYVRLSPDEERLALLTFDPLAGLAVYDDKSLHELLADVRPFVAEGPLADLLTQLASTPGVEEVEGLDGLLDDTGDKAPAPRLTEEQGEHLDTQGRTVTEQPPDQLKALRERWGTAQGQVWRIPSGTTTGAAHVLLIGDCLDPQIVERATVGTDDRTVVVTSPPYGMGQDYEDGFTGNQPVVPTRSKKGEADRRGADQPGGRPTKEGVDAWRSLIWEFAGAWSERVAAAAINLADHTVAPVAGYGRHTYGDLVQACATARWPYVATRFWYKTPNWGNNAYWLSSYKPVPEYEYVGFFADLERFPFTPVQARIPDSEPWRFRSHWAFTSVPSQQVSKGHHPAAFPVELPRRCLLLFTDPGGTVVDPFAGSGTTLVAAEGLGRVCVAVERDPTFAAMLLERVSRLGIAPEKVDG